MKKRIITGVVLIIAFVAAIIGFSVMLNRGSEDTTADMGGVSLPVISFREGDYTINELPGYTESMDITTMRDMVLPLSVGTTIKADITGYSGGIDSVTYEVCTLDGKKSVRKEVIKNVKDTINIELGDSVSDGDEKVLKIKLRLENGQDVYYYVRVIRAAEFNVQQCLEFAEYVHNTTLSNNPEELKALKPYLILGKKQGSSSLQTVTLNSSLEQMGWGSLKPEVEGDIRWQIKESTETYTSIYLKYQVKSRKNLYNVTEFLKVRFIKGKASLEDYERTMNQVFSGEKKNFDQNGIVLGVADENVPYLANKEGDIITFIQEREVWNYNKKENEVSLVFSFADAENNDSRNYNDNHMIRLIDMDKEGNTTFAVYGYMNRGVHEGQVGAAIYYFDIVNNCVEEKAFIPSKQSGEIAAKKLNQLVYYSKKQNTLYVMFDGALYQVDLETKKKDVLVKNLEENQYVASEDGKYLAYQSNGTLTEATAITVWNLKSGKNYQVKVSKDEIIRPLGFMQGDAVYGIGKKADIGKTVSGETVLPLYKLEIRNAENEVVKTYEMGQVYVLSVQVSGNMVTLNRVEKSGGTYTSIPQDYITNNKVNAEQTIKIETYQTGEDAMVQVRLADAKADMNAEPELLKPKQKLKETPTTIDFNLSGGVNGYYVYARGKLQGIYEKAGAAIVAADPLKGVVVTSEQKKIWERGNRQLRYSMENAPAFAISRVESSFIACLQQMLTYEGKNVDVAGEMKKGKSTLDILNEHSGGEAVDLSGCTIEELFYIIGKGTPVLAMTGDDSAILLVGYDDTSVTYLNPRTGRKPTEIISAIEKKVSGSQSTFIGYVK